MIILDTNVVSELMKATPASNVTLWIAEQPARETYLTAITRAEILYGIELLPHGRRRAEVADGATAFFAQLANPILPFDSESAAVFSQIAASRRRMGRPIDFMDAQIAAIALSHGASLATRDSADFARCGLRLINPWRR